MIHLIFELFAGPYIAAIIALLAAVAAYGVPIVALWRDYGRRITWHAKRSSPL
ncbi:MAG: hypothetical protein ACLR08_01815 [Dorea longicatena]